MGNAAVISEIPPAAAQPASCVVRGDGHDGTLQVHPEPARQRRPIEHHLVLDHPAADQHERDGDRHGKGATVDGSAQSPPRRDQQQHQPHRVEDRSRQHDQRAHRGEADQREAWRSWPNDDQPHYGDETTGRRELVRRCERAGEHLRVEHHQHRETTPTHGRLNRRASNDASSATLRTPKTNSTSCRLMASGAGDQASTAPTIRFHIGGLDVEVPHTAERIGAQHVGRDHLPSDVEVLRREPLTRDADHEVGGRPSGRSDSRRSGDQLPHRWLADSSRRPIRRLMLSM